MEEFLRRKRTLVEAGCWKEEDFVKVEELGFGNGGMVLKVRHRVTEIVMARKVRPLHPPVPLKRWAGPSHKNWFWFQAIHIRFTYTHLRAVLARTLLL